MSSAGSLSCSNTTQLSPEGLSRSPHFPADLRPAEISAFSLLGGLQAGLVTAVLVLEPGERHFCLATAGAASCNWQEKHAAVAGYKRR